MILTSSLKDFIGIIISIILFYVAIFYYKYVTRSNPLPGSFPLPFIGNLFGMIYYAKGDRSEWNKILNQRYGDIYELYVGDVRKIVLARADYVEKLMSSSKNSNYLKIEKETPVLEEIGFSKRGMLFNNHVPTWRFN